MVALNANRQPSASGQSGRRRAYRRFRCLDCTKQFNGFCQRSRRVDSCIGGRAATINPFEGVDRDVLPEMPIDSRPGAARADGAVGVVLPKMSGKVPVALHCCH